MFDLVKIQTNIGKNGRQTTNGHVTMSINCILLYRIIMILAKNPQKNMFYAN